MSRKTKDPVHRIFVECSDIHPDESWSKFLMQCSYNKFPKGVKFENGTLKCTKRGKTFVCVVPLDVKIALGIIMEVFRDKLGIKTSTEKKKNRELFEKKRDAIGTITSWSDISKKTSYKISMLKNFADRFARNNHLSPSEEHDLMSLLLAGMATKSLTYDDMPIVNGKIDHIKGLRFNYQSRRFYIPNDFKIDSRNVSCRPAAFTPVPQIRPDYEQAILYDRILDKVDRSVI